MNKRLKPYKGITLIALVITIIVLLILAGVSIVMLTGENGILNRAVSAREEASHTEVKEQVLLAIAEYELEKKTPEGSKAETIIDYLGQNGYLTEYDSGNPKESYVIQKAKLGEATLGKGTSKETGDVYVIEKANLKAASITKLASTQEVGIKIAEASTDNNWALKYYKTSNDENPKVLLDFPISKNSSPSKPKQIATNTSELVAGDYIDYVYEKEDGTKEKIPCIVLYDKSDEELADVQDGIQIITAKCLGNKILQDYDEYVKVVNDYDNPLLCQKFSSGNMTRVVGSNSKTGLEIELSDIIGTQLEGGWSDFDTYYKDLEDWVDYKRLSQKNILKLDNSYWYNVKMSYPGEYTGYGLLEVGTDGDLCVKVLQEQQGWTTGNGDDAPPYLGGESGLRLVFKLKDELPIIGGTGEVGEAYQLVETE